MKNLGSPEASSLAHQLLVYAFTHCFPLFLAAYISLFPDKDEIKKMLFPVIVFSFFFFFFEISNVVFLNIKDMLNCMIPVIGLPFSRLASYFADINIQDLAYLKGGSWLLLLKQGQGFLN